ncbi:Glyoxalase/bleomycin resistance protein/dioxygenase [Burkholderia multivorans]
MKVTVPVRENSRDSLFGRVRMGYVLAESRKLAEWQRFVTEGLGLHADIAQPGVLACRLDAHARRLIVRDGDAEDVIAIGWQLDDEAALQLALKRLGQRGLDVQEGGASDAAVRGVVRFWSVKGPKGLKVEMFTDAVLDSKPLRMKVSGIVTGQAGMGHVAITTRRPEAMQAFWKGVFDARLSDEIEERIDGIDLELTFLRLNERHHSLATASTRGVRINPLRTQIHHLNLQCASLEDVVQGYLRCRELGYSIANSIGQHPNDRELSFYVASPSGFELELGWNPIVVDEKGWSPCVYKGMSLWGHRPENMTVGARLRRFRQGLMSLTRNEFVVPGELS